MNANPKFLSATAKVDEAAVQPFPNSRKVYVQGSRPDIRVPMREITLSDTSILFGNEKNPPIYVYDTSGPYTAHAASITTRPSIPTKQPPPSIHTSTAPFSTSTRMAMPPKYAVTTTKTSRHFPSCPSATTSNSRFSTIPIKEAISPARTAPRGGSTSPSPCGSLWRRRACSSPCSGKREPPCYIAWTTISTHPPHYPSYATTPTYTFSSSMMITRSLPIQTSASRAATSSSR